MNSGTLDMLHNTGDKEVRTVADSVNLDLSTHKVLIYQHRVFKLCSRDDSHIFGNIAVAVSNYHILTAQNV